MWEPVIYSQLARRTSDNLVFQLVSEAVMVVGVRSVRAKLNCRTASRRPENQRADWSVWENTTHLVSEVCEKFCMEEEMQSFSFQRQKVC